MATRGESGIRIYTADAFNRFERFSSAVFGSMANQLAAQLPDDIDAFTCDVRNQTGSALSRYSVVGIDGPLILPSENLERYQQRVRLDGVTPAGATHAGKFAVLLADAPAGAIVPAAVAGPVQATVNITDASHKYCDAGSTTGQLVSGEFGGARILWSESSTGVTNAIVSVGAGCCESLSVDDWECSGIAVSETILVEWEEFQSPGDNGDYDGSVTLTFEYDAPNLRHRWFFSDDEIIGQLWGASGSIYECELRSDGCLSWVLDFRGNEEIPQTKFITTTSSLDEPTFVHQAQSVGIYNTFFTVSNL